MKIFGSTSLSYYLWHISRILTLGVLVLLCFILLSFLFGNFEVQGNRFSIEIPLTGSFIKGFYQSKIITAITFILLFYGGFFYMLSRVFAQFKAEPLFTEATVKELGIFAKLNLLGSPLAFIIIHIILVQQTSLRDAPSYILHILIGIFFLFITEIFKKGYLIQSENDLTI